jgi:hypothetical protein
LDLVEKGPEDDFEGEEALAAVLSGGFLGEQSDRDIGAKKLAELGERITRGELGQRLLECRGRVTKEERAETPEKRSLTSWKTRIYTFF